MFYSAKTGGFYSREIHGADMPDDVTEITAEEHVALINGQAEGKLIAADENGRPVLADQPPPPPLTREQVEQLRLKAYADPVSGSDRYFAEAARKHAMGEDGWEAVRASGVDRFEEIKEQYPWP